MAEEGEVTIVGAGARLEGNVVSAGNLRIDGQVKGQINAEGDVALSPQSQVEADIRAQNVSIAGRFKGSIQVKGKAHLGSRWPDRRQHHLQDARGRGRRRLPRAEHHGRLVPAGGRPSAGQRTADRPRRSGTSRK